MRVGRLGASAMAVGGMIGGGIFTLAGVVLEAAGALAWLSLLLGAALALATVRSYARLATAGGDGDLVPIRSFTRAGYRGAAALLAWGLLAVYILALAVYTFTVGHYLGRALGFSEPAIIACEAAILGGLLAVNLLGLQSPAILQMIAVGLALTILGALAAVGFARWNVELVTSGPPATAGGVVIAAASTFIAFEGFEMLAYDQRELRRPRKVLRAELPRTVIAVAATYSLVVIGAASLVGADRLIEQQEHALGVAGEAAAGTIGLVVVTVAACASGISAINATLFSVARLARSTAEHGLLPRWCARCNRRGVPQWSAIAITCGALGFAAVLPLRPLVAIASLGFLGLFCLVNAVAFRRLRTGRYVALVGAIGAAIGVIAVVSQLARGRL